MASRLPRLSVRHQVLFVVSALLLVAMGTYLWVATRLFTQDKIQYVYDIQRERVESLARQTASELGLLEGSASALAREESGAAPASRAALAADWFAAQPDALEVAWYSRAGAGWKQEWRWLNDAALAQTQLPGDSLPALDGDGGVPLDAVESTGDAWLSNLSVAPEAALLALATPAKTRAGNGIVVVLFRHERLLRLFERSRAFLVNAQGQVLASADAKPVIARADMSGDPLVKIALKGTVHEGVKDLAGADGKPTIGSWASVGVGGLTVLTTMPREVALSASRKLVHRSVLFAIAIVLAAFVVSVFFSRALTRPILELHDATEQVAAGRFEVQLDRSRQDEIGDLSRAFGDMAGKLQDTQAQLVQAAKLAAIGQLGAGITHEVKNPLAGIVGMAQLAKARAKDDAKLGEMLGRIEASGQRCVKILEKLLTFARPESRRFEAVDANALVQEADKLVRHQLKVSKVDLETIPAAAPAMLLADGPELIQVLLNLAINAQQAMQPKGGKVTLSVASEGDEVAIRVTDTGPGIAEEIRAKIFEPFFTTKKAGEGTGLGLSVSSAIVQDHHGRIDLQSEIGKGTTFTIRLPSKDKAQKEMPPAPPKKAEPESEPESIEARVIARRAKGVD